MFRLYKCLEGKKGIFVFSDPAGAKACLALASCLNDKDLIVISDREYSFFTDFRIKVHLVNEKSIHEWINFVKPDYIFTGTSHHENLELEFIKEGHLKNIRTYTFVDHWINIKQRFKSKGEYIFPSEIWLIDEVAKENAIKEEIPEELIRISNNPYYEFLAKWKPDCSKKEILTKLGLDETIEYILYAPEPLSTFNLQKKYGFDELDGLKHLISSLNQQGLNQVHIIIKGHPNQRQNVFDDFINLNNNLLYVHDFDINTLIFYSEVIVGYFSNSLIEASKLNKKVLRLLIDLKDKNQDSLCKLNIGTKVLSLHQLNDELMEVF